MKDVVIKLFTSKKCPNCPIAKKIVEKVAKEMKVKVLEIDITKEPEEALMHQVVSTPSIAINDETIFFGEIPKEEKLKEEIRKAMG
ncbi:MAG: thioredoxin family protein [Candidatus Parvarchaeota archaeon]|nr:thioredoxin family protein [Candidatus Jingweiarchaeum tengchongense]MCW1298373.1 thioredoxin family protein [Candidatus Jingweiarchaeum tengchongense]MCW1300325.1 thioredoxin family protein [Candidatus Jingweiarchaeum tengchongense]MCW1304878.1 thioredoxin family protein [Candidatus Jingweiarchaeum tengchongense]MCW1305821.1 thioredoxin family protein [Candidatus Jingweiarchaeum tengchongense]